MARLLESIAIGSEAGCCQMIQRGCELPTSYSATFSNQNAGQNSVALNVYQGESQQAKLNRLIGEFSFPISVAEGRATAQIQVTLLVDEQKQLTLAVQDVGSGDSREFKAGFVR